jgi:starvation-inducible DNA-binding protein
MNIERKGDYMKYLKQMNVYLSNLQVLNTKLHNLHWNVEGKVFFALHEKTEELYDELFVQYDDVAEMLKIKGEMPLATLAEYLENATLKEVKGKKFSPEEVISILLEDLTAVNEMARDLRNTADEAGDFTVVAMFEDIVTSFEKTLWFVRALQG